MDTSTNEMCTDTANEFPYESLIESSGSPSKHRHGVATKSRKTQQCYLCFYAEEEVCIQYAKYIINESQRCCKKQIAQQMAQDIEARETRNGGNVPQGASASDIEKHISEHVLHPSVKVPEIIRELDGVRRLLRSSITSTDPETGDRVIDTANVTLYLKVIRELHQVYKMGDTTKLTLGASITNTGISALNTDL
jgi:hypothetical protein